MFTLKIQSHKGHHECECEQEVATAVFERLTGKRKDPLPKEMKARLPDTFQDLEALWKGGKQSYLAVTPKGKDMDMEQIHEIDVGSGIIMFIPPIAGG
jgi:hypothetical protein